MTSTDRLEEMAAEIERLKHQNMLLEADIYTLRKEQHLDHLHDRLRIMEGNQAAAAREADRHISRLQARIAELEGQISKLIAGAAALATRALAAETECAITFGTLQQPTPDEPATITHGHAPSAPPHDE